MTVTSGRKCLEQYARFSPLTSLVKMLLASPRWYSPATRLKWGGQVLYSTKITTSTKPASSSSSKPSAKTLKVRTIPSSRLLFRLVPSARPIDATASGSSPDSLMLKTPCAFDAKDNLPPKQPKTSSTGTLAQEIVNGIAAQRGLLPTPLTQGLKTCEQGKSIPIHWQGLMPTPMATEVYHPERVQIARQQGLTCFRSRTNKEKDTHPSGLMDFIDFHGLLITPGAIDGGVRAAFNMEQLSHHRKKNAANSNLSEQIAHKIGGGTSQLNPLFVEEMMGFPFGWTTFPFLTPPTGEEDSQTTSPDGAPTP